MLLAFLTVPKRVHGDHKQGQVNFKISMNSRHTFYLLSCVVSLCHSDGITLIWPGKQLKSDSYKELAVSGHDLKLCESRRNVCVMDIMDCSFEPLKGKEMFLDTSCHYLVHERSFVCKWIYLDDAKIINSFIFSQTSAFSHCPSIFNPLADFNLIIKSKNIIDKKEMYSEVYAISIANITQAPRPTIMSVNATETSIIITWMTGQFHSSACQIFYKLSTSKFWTVVSVIPFEEKFPENLYTINGLQPFSQYDLTIACRGAYGLWSDWSAEYQAMTLESAPTAPPYVSYCVEPLDDNFDTQKLVLLWKSLERGVAQGVILGYEVTYTSTKRASLKRIINTTDLKAVLEIAVGNYNITVKAYNIAGHSPAQHVGISTGFYQRLPAVKGLWAIAEASSLRIRWEIEKTAMNVTEFAIEWFPFHDVASKQWKRLNGSFSTVLPGSIRPLKTYNISVYPLCDALCGPPASVQASLKHGTLLDIVQLKLVNVTKTSVTVKWVWQEKAPSTSTLQYRLALRGLHEIRSLVVFPHQWTHTFYRLQTNVKYSVYIYGETTFGNYSKTNIEFTTPFLENDGIIKAVVPIVFLIIGFGIFSILSRAIYKDSSSNIINPGHSFIGHWLLHSLHERDHIISVLKLEDFTLPNQVIEKSLIQIEYQMSDEEDFDEDKFLSKIYPPHDCPEENSVNVENSLTPHGLTEYVDLPLIPGHSEYVVNCPLLGSAS
ncbi:interleukin-31 receptor subunit alpha isoform X2 [Electrophorus electricus]|uniref:interleukin-31 receptor subunit alpha isoform X2 n=1 Tax=Electrophorus electricus TaxID=8005 RepID=UPI0015D00894|nr:interleukin-31 receptor subunit alpha isoform X2 [Electrophorus electricus]